MYKGNFKSSEDVNNLRIYFQESIIEYCNRLFNWEVDGLTKKAHNLDIFFLMLCLWITFSFQRKRKERAGLTKIIITGKGPFSISKRHDTVLEYQSPLIPIIAVASIIIPYMPLLSFRYYFDRLGTLTPWLLLRRLNFSPCCYPLAFKLWTSCQLQTGGNWPDTLVQLSGNPRRRWNPARHWRMPEKSPSDSPGITLSFGQKSLLLLKLGVVQNACSNCPDEPLSICGRHLVQNDVIPFCDGAEAHLLSSINYHNQDFYYNLLQIYSNYFIIFY